MLRCSLRQHPGAVNASPRSPMVDMTVLPPPRHALESETRDVHGVLWSCWREIPLTESFWQDRYVEWVRDHCANGRFWVIDQDDEIAGVMLVTPKGLGVIKSSF